MSDTTANTLTFTTTNSGSVNPTGNFSMASQEVLYELKEGVEINPQELFCTFGYRNEEEKLEKN